MANDLRVMLSLARQSKRRIALFRDFTVAHHLNDLCWLWNDKFAGRRGWNLSVHQGLAAIIIMKNGILKYPYVVPVVDGKSPYPSNFPDVDLTIGNYVRAGRGEVPTNAGSNAVYRLAYIDRHII